MAATSADADLTRPGFAGRAVLRLSAIEFWERYSFYNMFALLTLFMVAPVARGGLGWADGRALRFFGLYLVTVTTAPLLGGFLTDRWLKGDRALKFGAIGLMIGHGLLAASAILPSFAGDAGGATLAHVAGQAGVPLGGLWTPSAIPAALGPSYLATSLCFYGAVLFVAVGNGLFKPIITVVLGRLPHASAGARDRAFLTFFLFINMGGILSTLVGGWLAQSYGWGAAFGAAAGGMAVSLVVMAVLQRRYIRPYLAPRAVPAHAAAGGSGDANFVRPVAVVLAVGFVLAIAVYQSYGLVSLFTDKLVDRTMFGLVVPPSWFTSINPITTVVLAPILLRLWRSGGPGHDWSATTKFGAAFVLLVIGFAALTGGALQAQTMGRANPLWVATAIALLAIGELLTAPTANATMTRLVPPRYQNLAVGGFSATIGIGSWLSGQIGALAMETKLVPVLVAIGAGAAVCSAVLLLGRKRLAKLAI